MTEQTVADRHAVSPQMRLVALPEVLPLMLVSLYAMLAPVWVPVISSRVYDDARYLQLGLFMLSALLLLNPPIRRGVVTAWNDLGSAVRWLLMVFLIGGIASGTLSDAPQLAALEIGLITQLVFMALVVCVMVRLHGATADRALAVAACAGAGLIGMQFWLAQTFSLIEGRPFTWVAPFLNFANVRFFSQYQSYVLLLLPLPMLVLPMSRGWKLGLYAIGANFWALQWMVGTRAVWVAFFVTVVMVCLLTRHGRVAFVRTHALMIVGGAIIFAAYLGATSQVKEVTTIPQIHSVVNRGNNSINERVVLVREALGAIADKPLTGVGPGQFGLLDYPLRAAHPHSAPLQLLAEFGLIAGGAGCALGLIMVVFAARSMRGSPTTQSDTITVTVAAALMMGLTESLFSGGIIMPHGQTMLCILAGWLLGRCLPSSVSIVAPAQLATTRLAIVCSVFAAVFVTTLLAVEYWGVVWDMPISAQRWHPHFWQYGRFPAW